MRLTNRVLCVFRISVCVLFMGYVPVKASAQAANVILPQDLNGEWTLVSIYKTPNISGISPEQARSLVGSRIKYEGGMLIACKQHVKIEKVDEKDISAAQFLSGRKRTRFSDVEIYAPSIKEITINANSSGNCFDTYALPGEDVYVKSQNELLVDFEGVYFRALRRVPAKSK